MSDYILSCCSTADLSAEHLKRRSIAYLCYHFTMDGKDYLDDMGQSIGFKDFYEAIANGAETHTTLVNIEQYIEYFTPFLAAGQDVLHVTLSSGITSTYNSARNAAAILREDYPDRKIYIVDSRGASSGYGLLMDKLADLRDSGMDIDTLYDWTEENKFRVHHWFFSTDLSFYIRGGRISKTAGAVATALNICPLLHMDEPGNLVPVEKIRSKKRVIAATAEKMRQLADNGTDYDGKCFISHSDSPEDAEAVAALVRESFPKIDGEILMNSIGTVIGSHTGPGTVALFFWGKDRRTEDVK